MKINPNKIKQESAWHIRVEKPIITRDITSESSLPSFSVTHGGESTATDASSFVHVKGNQFHICPMYFEKTSRKVICHCRNKVHKNCFVRDVTICNM